VGIVSQGLITNTTTTNVVTQLLTLRYACVIVDESHRARRRDITDGRRLADAPPNKLLEFVQKIAARTTTMLLATATPVQIDPIEAWDLLHALAQNAPGYQSGENKLKKAWTLSTTAKASSLVLPIAGKPRGTALMTNGVLTQSSITK
jgi:hypothetical protein